MLTRMDHKVIRPALEAITVKKAVAIDCLSEAECNQYVEWADSLGYRQARAVTGSEAAPVRQDFELNYEIPQDHFFWNLAKSVEKSVGPVVGAHREAAGLSHEPLIINDLIAQRYPPGCRGITPHRDHVSYRFVVLILLLSGDGTFSLHTDREAGVTTEVSFLPGQLLLMGAPGISADFKRPYHSVKGVSQTRRTIGFRYDSRLV